MTDQENPAGTHATANHTVSLTRKHVRIDTENEFAALGVEGHTPLDLVPHPCN